MLFRRSAGFQWLAVFLGNPGQKYAGTRHNAGFLACDALARSESLRVDRLRFRALTAKWELPDGQSVLVMKPQTFMNNSGEAVGQAARFYKLPADHVLVVADDISLPLGRLRVRTKGSAGGHNGLKSIIAHLGTDAFPRIKIGVGAPGGGGQEQIDWVLGVPQGDDRTAIGEALFRAADAVEVILKDGFDKAMNQFN